MICQVYIIYSERIDKYYIGQTTDLCQRLSWHNSHEFKGSFTIQASDWRLFFKLECSSSEQALKIEQHIKRNRNRKYYLNLSRYPDVSEKLLEKYGESLPR